ncbi:MAG TPA: hypothetical protein VMM13_08245 [Euzebya sp.]|nr:hypothetical protein [Euzebya sp.]
MQEFAYELALQRMAEMEALSRRPQPISHHGDRRPLLARFRKAVR